MSCMHAMCPSDVNRQGHLRNYAVLPPLLINTHSPRSLYLLPPRHLAQTLAPPLARVDAGDKALSCRDIFDAVLTPATDLVLSAAAVGVFRCQVMAREIELLGLSLHLV